MSDASGFHLSVCRAEFVQRICSAGGAAADDSAPVSGVILDQAGLPVIGAFVLQKGTSNGTITDPDGKFTIEIPSDAVAITGYDPEFEGSESPLKEVLWMSLDEISEKDRAFLWSYGLMQVDGFFSKICEWDNAISYPGKE